jgi:hypothetical protein
MGKNENVGCPERRPLEKHFPTEKRKSSEKYPTKNLVRKIEVRYTEAGA